jgi:3-hydroxybutyryl-CoA dehydratase
MKPSGVAYTEFTITWEKVSAFTSCVGDSNPLHCDGEFASDSRFKRPIVPGMLPLSLITGFIGTEFPGFGTILQDVSITYMKPVYPGDTIRVKLYTNRIEEKKRRAVLGFDVHRDDDYVIKGWFRLFYTEDVDVQSLQE